MRQIWISKAGGPEVLVVKEALDPQPAPDSVSALRQAASIFLTFPTALGCPVLPRIQVAGVDPLWNSMMLPSPVGFPTLP
jgi:hypothetical protein